MTKMRLILDVGGKDEHGICHNGFASIDKHLEIDFDKDGFVKTENVLYIRQNSGLTILLCFDDHYQYEFHFMGSGPFKPAFVAIVNKIPQITICKFTRKIIFL